MTSNRPTTAPGTRASVWGENVEPSLRVSMRNAFDDGEEDRDTGPLVQFDPGHDAPPGTVESAGQ